MKKTSHGNAHMRPDARICYHVISWLSSCIENLGLDHWTSNLFGLSSPEYIALYLLIMERVKGIAPNRKNFVLIIYLINYNNTLEIRDK